MQVDPETLWKIVERGITPLALVYAFIRGWIVPQYVYLDVRDREKRATDILLRNTELANRAVASTERLVERGP